MERRKWKDGTRNIALLKAIEKQFISRKDAMFKKASSFGFKWN